MSAREELHESLCGSCQGRYSRGECEAVDRLIDNFAHELAEKIRCQYGQAPDVYSVADCANLVDPEAQR